MREIKRIIFHHTGDSETRPQFSKINGNHRSLDFPMSQLGNYVGYHILIEHSSHEIIICRLFSEIGAHDKGENHDSVGIALAMNGNASIPCPQCEEAFARSCEMVFAFVGNILPIEPHRLNDTTDCPGKYISNNWGERTYAKHYLSFVKKLLLWISKTLNF